MMKGFVDLGPTVSEVLVEARYYATITSEAIKKALTCPRTRLWRYRSPSSSSSTLHLVVPRPPRKTRAAVLGTAAFFSGRSKIREVTWLDESRRTALASARVMILRLV